MRRFNPISFLAGLFLLSLFLITACARNAPTQKPPTETQAVQIKEPESENSKTSQSLSVPTFPMEIEKPCEKKYQCTSWLKELLRQNPYSSEQSLEIHPSPFSAEKEILSPHQPFKIVGFRLFATQSTPIKITPNDVQAKRCWPIKFESAAGGILYPLAIEEEKNRSYTALVITGTGPGEQMNCRWFENETPPQYSNQLWYRILRSGKLSWWAPPKECVYQEKGCAILKSEASKNLKDSTLPPLPYAFPHVCEGEDCRGIPYYFYGYFYSDSDALLLFTDREIPLYSKPFSEKPIGKIKKGEKYDLMGFTLYALKAEPYRLTRSDVKNDACSFEKRKPGVGDTVYLLAYSGEGNYFTWYRGEINFCDSRAGLQNRKNDQFKTQLWFQVFAKEGIGWTRQYPR